MCPLAVAGCTPWRIGRWRRRDSGRVGRRGAGVGVSVGIGKSDGEFDLFASEIARLAASNRYFNHRRSGKRGQGQRGPRSARFRGWNARTFCPSMSSSYGPQLPQRLANNQAHESNDDAYRPALPPHLAAKKKSQHAQQPTRRSPEPITHLKTTPQNPSAPTIPKDSDSDDDFGPPPPTAGVSTTSNEDAVREFKEREQRRKELAEVCYLSSCYLYSLRQSFPQCVLASPASSRPITLLKL